MSARSAQPVRRLLALAALVLASAGMPLGRAALAQDPDDAAPPAAAAKAAPQAAKPAEPTAAAKPDDEPKWDVANPPGPSHEVPIDVREGTWMSLDVSPDGRTVAFDLLGDLYTVPIGGGEATAVTTGVSWDIQPRFSPDGKSLAFTSDRGGGDNLWTVRLVGTTLPVADGVPAKDAKSPLTQVSHESFRLLNSPAWTPDGQFLAGRKHFTSHRSAGAGEIWLYHRTGGEGLQLTKRPNEEKDVGEPAFSPDGRYLYFSRDATPGDRFEYSKDPNAGIYTIFRLDRETGDVEAVTGGTGGAVRPTPSPDGRTLAFVRRVRYRSVLTLLDLRSGVERPLYDGLDRDMQETWAIHGVYPTMAWTPDGKSLVFWAGGKIRRIDVATRAVADIPFHVTSTRTVFEALRHPVEVAPKRFHTRMLRWAQVSPAGDQVVFQALGRLWVRALSNGTPRRLTKQEDHVELWPSWSRDGRSIVYTTWDDDAAGSVRVVPAAGGEGRTLVSEPGTYAEPVFSPDGTRVVYRKGTGGDVRAPYWSRDPGLYVVAAGGGVPKRIEKDGALPHFGASSDRVYFLRNADERNQDKRELVSVDLGGADERTHVTSEEATEYRVSPDGRWLAFREGWNVYLLPFVPTGRTVDVGPKAASVPLRKLSRDAGAWLYWSGDSKKLWWTNGPELFGRELRESFAWVEGAAEKLPDPAEHGIDLGFDVDADVPSGRIALVGGKVVTQKGDEVIADGTVLVEGNRIVAVGPRGEVAIPAGTRVFDVAGKTVMPGIVDVHWHGSMASDDIVPEQNWVLDAALGFGVTTLHDPSNDTGQIFSASELQRAGDLLGPRIFSTGTILYGAAGDFKAEIDSLDDARSHLRRMQEVGAFSVKSYNQPRREQRQQVIAAARELGMMVVPEGGSDLPMDLTIVVDGHTGLEHSLPVANVYEDVKQLWAGTKVGYTPTLIVAYGGNSGENYWYQHTNVWEDPRLSAFVPRDVVDARSRRRVMSPEDEWNHVAVARGVKQLHDRGVEVQLGAHGQREGLGAHWEMWMMAQGGMTPLEVLRAATIDGARYLGLDRDLGSLEPGKLADVIVLDGDPLQDIRQTNTVRYTMANGRLYDAATLDELAPVEKKRAPLWFEKENAEQAAVHTPAPATTP